MRKKYQAYKIVENLISEEKRNCFKNIKKRRGEKRENCKLFWFDIR